jgi:hypothetical protein
MTACAWRRAVSPRGDSDAKGSNSGVYLNGLYEVQVFDSDGKPPSDPNAEWKRKIRTGRLLIRVNPCASGPIKMKLATDAHRWTRILGRLMRQHAEANCVFLAAAAERQLVTVQQNPVIYGFLADFRESGPAVPYRSNRHKSPKPQHSEPIRRSIVTFQVPFRGPLMRKKAWQAKPPAPPKCLQPTHGMPPRT